MTLEKALRWIVIAGIFVLPFVPLIVTSSLFFPYITGKNFTFRVLVEILAGAWLALALVDVKYRPKRGWILGCFALFIIIIALADAQGANPFKSFWSNYERMDGWVTIAHLFVYLVVTSIVINAEQLWRKLFQLSIAISAFLSVYGFMQIYGALAIGGGSASGLSARIDVTFGNPIYLAVYMLFHIFLAALLIAQEGKERWNTAEKVLLPVGLLGGFVLIAAQSSSAGTVFPIYLLFVLILGGLMFLRRQYILYCVIALDTLALFFTGTRGTELGLIGGAVLAVLLYAFIQGSKRTRWIAAACVAVVIVIAGGLHFARNTSFVMHIGSLERLASISLTDDTIHARLLNIGIAWQGVKERPILGWGQENYAIVFDKYYDPRMYAQEPWFDRVHDVVFDWLIAGGILGLAAYLSIFGATLWALWRKTVAGVHAFTVAERSIITGLLAGYFFHNLTVFDNVTSYILFGTLLGYIAWRSAEARKSAHVIARKLLPLSALPFVAVGMALVVWGIAWAVNANALAENRTLLSALETGNLATFQQAISYGTYGTQEAREQLAQVATEIAPSSQATDAIKQQYFQTSIDQMMQQEKVSPLDARFPLFIGTVEDAYGDYADASTSLAQALSLSPRKQAILFQVGFNDEALNDFASAVAVFKQAYELDTDNQQALIYYAAALIESGDEATGSQLLAPMIASGAAADPHVAAAYAAQKDYAKIVTIWAAHIAANPTDASAYPTLAAAYYEMGNTAKAISTLQDLIAVSPSSAGQANAFIDQIKSGTAKVN